LGARFETQFAMISTARNVLGEPLRECGRDPLTGFFRDGCCNTGEGDFGLHLVCAVMDDEFLQFSQSQGNDLITPVPQYGFAGLRAGDRWCLCVSRWKEAFAAGVAPKVDLHATHISALEWVKLDELKAHAL